MKRLLLLSGLMILLSGLTFAQEHHPSEDHHTSSHAYNNKLAVFSGYSNDLRGHTGPKVGFEYIRVMSRRVSLRLALDYLGQDYKYTSLSGTVDFRPFQNVPFYTGVGFGAKGYKGDWNPFTRFLLAYDIHFGRFSIGPIVMYDIYSLRDYLTTGLGFDYSF